MTDNLSEIEAQIAELQKKKEELLKKKEELPLTVTVDKYDTHMLKIKTSKYDEQYVAKMRTIPSRRWDWSNEWDTIEINDYTTWIEHVRNTPNITINYNKDVLEYIHYYLYGNHLEVSLAEKDAVCKLHPKQNHYTLFGNLYPTIAIQHRNDWLYHIPKNELHRLLVILNDYQYPDKIHWEKDALDLATKDLEGRQRADEIALAEDAPEYDIDLNGHHLRPFQRVGAKFGIETKNTIGNGNIRVLIADEMGLGKTWQAIAIAELSQFKRIAVICPASVKENWRREIERLTQDRARIMVGTNPNNMDLQDILLATNRYFIFNYDILARPIKETKQTETQIEQSLTYLWIKSINSLMFDAVILDEAHKCKNIDAARTKAVLRLKVPNLILLTGTPVLNRPLELWPGLHLLSPDIFNNQDGFKRRYTDGNYGVRNLPELRNVLRPYMIRRTKTDVMKELPPIIRTTQYVEMTPKQRELYTKVLNSILIDLESGEERGSINHILVKILRLKQYLSYIKAEAVAEFAIELFDQAEEEDRHKKVIVFSQFVPIVHKILRRLGNEARYIIGAEHKPEDRQLIVDEFQTDKRVQFLVATPQSTSEGLNITAAGHVVFCDFMWTPAVHHQAEGRAYGRLADAHTIESHYFAIQNSLDDWLRAILMQKLETIEAIVDGVQDARMQEGSIIKELIKALKSGEIR